MHTPPTSLEIPLLLFPGSTPPASPTAHPSASNFHKIPSWFTLGILPGLLLTTSISILLIYTAHTNKTLTGSPYNFVTSNRATIQIVVQVVSHTLGLIHVFVLTTLFNAFTREWHGKRAVSLDCLKWWNSMCHVQFDVSLPAHFIIPLLLFIAFSLFPAAFWTGAITPIESTQTQIRNFSIPQYGSDPKGQFWNNSDLTRFEPAITRTALGSFSYNPVRNIVGSMIDEASLATAPNASYQTHRKLDDSGFVFRERSYGVGASIGLERVGGNDTKQYTFSEDGYMSNITCWYNRTMNFHVHLTQQNSNGMPSIYSACGLVSDGSDECVYFPGRGDDHIVAMLGNPLSGHYQWGMATGINATRYANLNQTSCELVFHPMNFAVSVDTVQKIINVTATGNVAEDIDPSSTSSGPVNGKLAVNVVRQMGLIVQVTSAAVFSPFGNALVSNIVNTNFSKINGYLPQSLNDSQISLMGIESALEAMADDILLAFAGAQFVIAAEQGGIKQTTMNATVAAIQIGEPSYIYTVSSINALLLLLALFEVSRNKGWKRLPLFDYRDLKSVVIGSSLGGGNIAAEVLKTKNERGEEWSADPGDKVAGRTMVWLDSKKGIMIKLSGNST